MADSLSGAFANGLVRGVGSNIAGEIISAVVDEFFPNDSPPVYFDAVYDAITTIVQQALESETTTQITGALTGIQQSMAINYFPAKASKHLNVQSDRIALQGILSTIESVFTNGADGMIGTLQQPAYAAAALPVFMVAASEHLAILQEMALIDPCNQDAQGNYLPAASSPTYATPVTGSIAVAASMYADYAATQWQAIQAARQAQISFAYDPYSQQWTGTISDSAGSYHIVMLQDIFCMTLWGGLQEYVGGVPATTSDPILTSTAMTVTDTETGNPMNRGFSRTVTDVGGTVLFSGPLILAASNPYADPIVQVLTTTYQAQVQTKLVTTLNDPASVIDAWQSLVTTPMGTPPLTAAEIVANTAETDAALKAAAAKVAAALAAAEHELHEIIPSL
jgi:hypothetical protein